MKIIQTSLFVFLVLTSLFVLQYDAKPSVNAIKEGYSISDSQPNSSSSNNNSNLPFNARELLRLELFLLFLLLLTHSGITFNIFQFPSNHIWIPDISVLLIGNTYVLKDRAPPINSMG